MFRSCVKCCGCKENVSSPYCQSDCNEAFLNNIVVDKLIHAKEKTASGENLNSLLAYIISDNIPKIRTLQSEINEIHPKLLKPPLLLAAADSNGFADVSSPTIEELINLGAQIDYFDRNWYGWEALHYASAATNPEKLRILIEKIPKDRINTLTTLSENALHVLLDYSKYSKSIEVPFQNGLQTKMSAIVTEENYQIVECCRLLVEAGVDVNHSNFYNETPLLLAIRRRYLQVVQEFLEIEGIDMDSCRDPISKKTARELLKGKESIFGLLPRPVKKLDCRTLLFHFLKAGDQDSFLKFNSGNIKDYVNRWDGDNPDNSSCTLLQFCFRKAFVSYFECLNKNHHEGLSVTGNIYNNAVVQTFCRTGMIKCIEHLLNNNADVNLTLRKFDRSLLVEAVMSGFYPFVCILLANKNSTISSQQICNLLPKLVSNGYHNVDTDNIFKCNIEHTLLVLLSKLDQLEQDNQIDRDCLNETLHRAVDKLHSKSICLLLELGGSLVYSKHDKIILERIHPDTLERHLDDCIENEPGGHEITINFGSLINQNEGITAIHFLLNSPTCNKFLNHFVIKTLIHIYWESLKSLFTINLTFYIALYCLLNFHILFQFNDKFYWMLDTTALVFIGMFGLREIVQCALNFRKYFFEINNIFEASFLCFTIIAWLTKSRMFMVMSVLMSNLVLLLLLEQVPKCAKYLIIFRTVVFYLKFIIFYFIQFVAFAVCFYILFFNPDEDGQFWETIPRKVFETIMFFTGNIESDKLNFANYPVFGRIVFLIFIFFMPLILNNLLLGLLMADMSVIQENTKLYEQTRRANFILRLTSFLNSNRNMLPRRLIAKGKLTAPHFVVRQKADLQEYDKHYVESVFKKRSKRPDTLNTLYEYIKTNMKKHDEETIKEINHELLEKLRLLEEKYRDLHDIKELLKLEILKNKL